MKYLLIILALITGFASCDSTNPTSISQPTVDGEAFFVGYFGGMNGFVEWYRLVNDQAEYITSDIDNPLASEGFANSENWEIMNDDQQLNDLIALRNGFPTSAFGEPNEEFCAALAYDGGCMRIGFGNANDPEGSSTWLSNPTENADKTAYWILVREFLRK